VKWWWPLWTLLGSACIDFEAARSLCFDAGRCVAPASDAGRVVTATFVDTYLTEDGTATDRPRSLGRPPTAFFEDGGAWSPVQLQGANGVYAAINAPPGPWLVELAPMQFVSTTLDRVDLSERRIGRVDQGAVAAGSTAHVTIAGLLPWQTGDQLLLASVNAGIASSRLACSTCTRDVTAGSSSAELWLDWALVPGAARLIPTDVAYLFQLMSPPVDGGVAYRAVRKSANVQGLSIGSGGSAELSATLVDPGQGSALKVRGTIDVEGLKAANQPLPGLPSSDVMNLSVNALPFGIVGAAPVIVFSDLRLADGRSPPIGDAGVFVDFEASNPLPSKWDNQLSMSNLAEGALQIPAPDGGWELSTSGEPLTARLRGTYFATTVNQLLRAPFSVVPMVSSPRNVSVDGQSTQTKLLAAIPLHPLVQWEAPALGTATGYELDVFRINLGVDTSGARIAGSSFVGSIRTPLRSVRLPPGFLTAGGRYFFGLCAWAQPNVDEARPLRPTLPWGTACAVTQVMTAK
jgi:hypothetical protein